jgi:hypothetical protein
MAAAAAWWMQTLSGPLRKIAWTVSLAAALGVTWTILGSTHQAGLRAVSDPGHSRGYFVYSQWRDWLGGLDSPGEPLRPALGYNEPVAAFYRLPVAREVRPEAAPDPSVPTAEALVRGRGGWLVVQAARFMGREGVVEGRTWLFGGDPRSPFSLAAYRSLKPGEAPLPMVYQRTSEAEQNGSIHELLLRSWSGAPLRFIVRNEGAEPCRFTVVSPLDSQSGRLDSAGEAEVRVHMPDGAVGEIRASFRAMAEGSAPPGGTSIELAP